MEKNWSKFFSNYYFTVKKIRKIYKVCLVGELNLKKIVNDCGR
ncbi:MAG: hypothetical protein MRERV_2c014 [Mycoplasmataceae bacterium RV_VA103A]|nr:MAG: hypothetical protein MRERV_2c014 [Mycoplasmataceae bacterium RV_VA103A]